MSDLAQFRSETRSWLAENCPAGARGNGPMSIGSSKQTLSVRPGAVARAHGGPRLDRADLAA